jgi:ribonucleoside-diphosphate reductase alpha chain
MTTCGLCAGQRKLKAVPEPQVGRKRAIGNIIGCPRCQPREKMPAERQSVGRKFKLGTLKMYVHLGFFPDGRPGEIFIRADHQSGSESSYLQAAATAVSVALQYGAKIQPIMQQWRGMRFEPAGVTGDPEFPMVSSPLDYVAKWVLSKCPEERA